MMRKLFGGLLALSLLSGHVLAQTPSMAPGQALGNDTAAARPGRATDLSPLFDRAFGAPSVQGCMLNRGATLYSCTRTPVLGLAGTATGTLTLAGVTSGGAVLSAQAAAGSPTLLLPTASGTLASTASSPIALSATTGELTCPTCVTSSGGGSITGTSPIAVSGAGAVSITGLAGGVLAGSGPAFTRTPVLGSAGTAVGTLGFQNLTSGTVTLQPVTGALGTVTINVPAAAGTMAVSGAGSIAVSAAGAISITGAALTKTDDTNVTLTLGGSASTSLVNAASLTLGWTGQLGLTRGGTAASLTASNGGVVYSTGSAMAILSGTATAGQHLQSGSSSAPSWTTATYPSTAAAGTILAAGTSNVITATATPTLGANGGTGGQVTLNGATSGSGVVRVAAAAGSGIIFQLPTANGSSGYALTTDGAGVTTWSPVGGTGTVTSMTPGAGLVSSVTASCSQTAVTTVGTFSAAECVNAQTGTSYAIVDGDRGKLVTASNAAAQAYTIAQAGASSAFENGWFVDVKNISTNPLGVVTITPATSTIDGAASYPLYPGRWVRIVSNGTNYITATENPKLPTVTVLTNGAGATYNAPTGATWIRVRAQGAGGGGGAATAAGGQTNVGAGGGGGAYVEHIITNPSGNYTYTVSNTGGASTISGTASTFSGTGATLSAGGGIGTSSNSGSGTTLARTSAGGAGGTPSGGNVLNVPGMSGNFALRYSGTEAISAAGGNSVLGMGGIAATGSAGGAAFNYGGGGGGGASLDTTPRAGGAGAPGIIIVEEFYN